MGGVVRRDAANVFHILPEAYKDVSTSHPICCWHCCEEMTDARKVIPLPRMYDATERVYHVYGATCSPGCAKAYIIEHTTFDRGQHLNYLTKMLRDVYGITGTVSETPPRTALKRFGGRFEPHAEKRPEVCRIVEPPFVSYCMIVSEHSEQCTEMDTITGIPDPRDMQVEEADTFDEPQAPALFENFMSNMDQGSSSTAIVQRGRKRTHTKDVGPMSKFVK